MTKMHSSDLEKCFSESNENQNYFFANPVSGFWLTKTKDCNIIKHTQVIISFHTHRKYHAHVEYRFDHLSMKLVIFQISTHISQ